MIHPRALLILEFTLLCIVLPTIIIVYKLAPFMFLFLWGSCLVCWLLYRRTHFKGWRELWRWDQVNWVNLKPMLIRWVICSIGLIVFTYFYSPDKFFHLLREKPEIIPWLLMLYPVLSALPQEFIFCSFFFDYFKPLFKTERRMILASAIVFAYAHVLFINIIAPVFSFIGGLIFAQTYARTRSLALVTIEHGLYGNVLFVVGLGWYFWAGALSQ